MTRALLIWCACAVAFPGGSLSEEPASQNARGPAPPKSDVGGAPQSRAAGAKSGATQASLPSRAAGSAIVEGRVKLPESKPAPVKIQRYTVVSKGNAVTMSPAVAVVYLEGGFPKPSVPPKTEMVQKNYAFLPALLPVQTGTRVEFPNYDDTYHNVFSYSKTKRFDLGRYLPSERPIPSQVFDKPGLVQLHCDIHEHMRAVILVVDTPHFARTEADGSFRLTGLPAGKYVLKAWLSSIQTLELPVELKGGTTIKADFP